MSTDAKAAGIQIGNLSYTSLSELQRKEYGLQARKLSVCCIVALEYARKVNKNGDYKDL